MAGAVVDARGGAEAVLEVGRDFLSEGGWDSELRVPLWELGGEIADVCAEGWIAES